MKRFLLVLFCTIIPVIAHADWSVTVNWTPSPDAATEILLLDNIQQNCPQPATCNFIVPALTNQAVVIRSANTQGGYVDYAAGNLSQTPIPQPASNSVIVITIVNP